MESLNTSSFVDPDTVENWKKLFNEVNVQCNKSLKEKLVFFAKQNLLEYPRAQASYVGRINSLINYNEEIMIMILRDIIEFKDLASCIIPSIEDLKKKGIIAEPPDVPPSFSNTAINVGKDLLEIKNFPIVLKGNVVEIKASTPQMLYKKIQARYLDAGSVLELKELLLDINILLKPIEGGKRKTGIIKKGGNAVDLNIASRIIGAVDLNIASRIIGGYANFMIDSKTLFDPKIARKYRVRSAMRIVGQTVILSLGLYCTLGKFVPLIGQFAVLTCPAIGLATTILSVFMNKQRKYNTANIGKQPEKNSMSAAIEDIDFQKNLLLFTLVKNHKIAWTSKEVDGVYVQEENNLMQDADGNPRTWNQFLLDVLLGNITSHETFNLCYVTMAGSTCTNMTAADFGDSYDFLAMSIQHIIKQIGSAESNEERDFILKRIQSGAIEMTLEKAQSELKDLQDRCLEAGRCIHALIKPLNTMAQGNSIDYLIKKTSDLIRSSNPGMLYKLTDNQLNSAIICLINFIITPGSEFPLKENGRSGVFDVNRVGITKTLDSCKLPDGDDLLRRLKLSTNNLDTYKSKESPSLNILIDAFNKVFSDHLNNNDISGTRAVNVMRQSDKVMKYNVNLNAENAKMVALNQQMEDLMNEGQVCHIDKAFDANGEVTQACATARKEIQDKIDALEQKNAAQGGAKHSKLFILGRNRNVIIMNRRKYIKYKHVLMSLSDAKKLDKTLKISKRPY